MTYVDAMICAVPTADKATYRAHAEASAVLFKRHGAVSIAECWGDDVPEGDVNSFHTAVLRKPDETVVLSWIIWPSKAARDDAWQALMQDPQMTEQTLPFDGARLIHGGFETLL